jgi:hypothetical protein
MALHQFRKGELAYWLGIIAEGSADQARQVPEDFVDALVTLRCIEVDPTGTPVITEKGRLALRMESVGMNPAS